MNLLTITFSRKFLFPALLILSLVFIYGLWERSPDPDDAWIGEYAYWLEEDGYVHSELMRGNTFQEKQLVVGHKLLNLHGALFIRIFGYSLYTLKTVSLLYFLIFIAIFFMYTVKWKKLFTINQLLFAFVLLISFPWIFKYAFVYRPEIMMMTFGFCGYILLEKFLGQSNRNLWLLFFSGIFFGLGAATHLNGLILIVSAFLLIFWNERYSAVILFGIGVLIAFSIYFHDYNDTGYFELWRHQFFDSPSLDSLSMGPAWLKPIINLLDEHKRYFHNPMIIVFSVLIISSAIIGYKYLYSNHANITRFALLVAIITGVVAMHKSRQYLLINFPYLVILITLTFSALSENRIKSWVIQNEKQKKIIQKSLVGIYSIFILVSGFYNIQLSLKKFSPVENRIIAEKYTTGNTKHMNIVAPMTFIFNEIKNFNRIQGDLCYYELQKNDTTIKGDGFFHKAKAFDIDLIMLSMKFQKDFGLDIFSTGDTIGEFAFIDKTDQLLVFKRLR